MNLPNGISNRPRLDAPHPAALVRVLRVMVVIAVLLAPFLIAAALQVKGVSWRYERAQLTERLAHEKLRRRHLLAERTRLTAPDRLREHAARLGLVPGRLGADSFVLREDAGSGGAP